MGRGLAHDAGAGVARCARRVAAAARRAAAALSGCFGCCSAQLDDSMEAATTTALLRREARRPARRRSAVPARRYEARRRSYGASPGTSPRAASNAFDALASEDWAAPPVSTRAAGGLAPATPPPEADARLERLAAMFPLRDHAPAAYF